MDLFVELACAVCTEEFRIAQREYDARSGVVECPCCGSTDLYLIGTTSLKALAPVR